MLGRLLKLYVAGPEHPAKVRVVRWLGRHLWPRQGVVGDVYPAERLWLHPADWIEYLMLRDGRYEPLTLDFLRANLRRGDRAIFAGVNNGLHTIVAAKAVGAAGRILACDPQPAALLRARGNIELNDVPAGSLVLVAAALGSAPDLVPMPWPPPDNPGAASFLTGGQGFIAPIFELGQLARALGAEPARLVLLDVQGYEDQVLAGLGPSLRPEIAIVEDDATFSAKAGVSRAALFDRLLRLGYSLHDVYGNPADAAGPGLPERNIYGILPGTAVRWNQPRD